VLHEALNGGKAGARLVAEIAGDLGLDIKMKAFLRLAGQVVHVASHRPEEVVGLLEQTPFLAGKHAKPDEIASVANVVAIFGDPEQGLQITQAALAFLDVGLDEIATVTGLSVAFVALGQLGGDEFRGGVTGHFLVEAAL